MRRYTHVQTLQHISDREITWLGHRVWASVAINLLPGIEALLSERKASRQINDLGLQLVALGAQNLHLELGRRELCTHLAIAEPGPSLPRHRPRPCAWTCGVEQRRPNRSLGPWA